MKCWYLSDRDVGICGNGKSIKVSVLHRNPLFKKPFMEESGAFQNPLLLGFFVHGQQNLQIVGVAEIGMVAVSTFYDVQPFGSNGNRSGKRKGTAIKGAVRKSLSGFQRKQHFFLESLLVHITAHFCKPFRGTLFRAEKEVIHVKYIAVIDLCQFGS